MIKPIVTNLEAYSAWLEKQADPSMLTGVAVFINGKFLAYGLTREKIKRKVDTAKKQFPPYLDPKPEIQYFNIGAQFVEPE